MSIRQTKIYFCCVLYLHVVCTCLSNPVFLKKCLKRFLKAYGLCSIPSNIHKYFIRIEFFFPEYGYHITAAKWARDNAMSYIGQVSWIYTWLHLIKNRRKWSDRLCFGQSMNMATTDLKQKTLIRKNNICEILYCVQRLFPYWRQFLEASPKGNKLLWCVYGLYFTPQI